MTKIEKLSLDNIKFNIKMSSWWMNKISEPQPYDPGVLIIFHHWLERWRMSVWIAPPETLFSELFKQAWILMVQNSRRTCIMKLQNRKNPDLPKASQWVGSCAVNSASKPCTLVLTPLRLALYPTLAGITHLTVHFRCLRPECSTCETNQKSHQ